MKFRTFCAGCGSAYFADSEEKLLLKCSCGEELNCEEEGDVK